MKTSTMGIIAGSSALAASAGALKAKKAKQRKQKIAAANHRTASKMQRMKSGTNSSVKTGANKTDYLVQSKPETGTGMLKSPAGKPDRRIKTEFGTRRKMAGKEKHLLDKVNYTKKKKKKKMSAGAVVGSAALLTTGLVLAYSKKQDTSESSGQSSSGMQEKLGGLKSGAQKAMESVKGGMGSKQSNNESDSQIIVERTPEDEKFISDKTVAFRKDHVETPDAEKVSEYEGLTELDAQYRDEWQANGVPQTHARKNSLENESASVPPQAKANTPKNNSSNK